MSDPCPSDLLLGDLADLISAHDMWIDADGQRLEYLPEREARITDFIHSAWALILADREKAVQQARVGVVERVEAAIAAEDGWQVPGQPEYVSAEAVRAALREAQP